MVGVHLENFESASATVDWFEDTVVFVDSPSLVQHMRRLYPRFLPEAVGDVGQCANENDAVQIEAVIVDRVNATRMSFDHLIGPNVEAQNPRLHVELNESVRVNSRFASQGLQVISRNDFFDADHFLSSHPLSFKRPAP